MAGIFICCFVDWRWLIRFLCLSAQESDDSANQRMLLNRDGMLKFVESGDNYSHSVGYEYDKINNLTALVETINGVKHTTSYDYDKDNRVTSVTSDGTTKSYTYDGYGRVTQRITKRGEETVLTEILTYWDNASGAPTSQVKTHRTQSKGYDVTNSYTYDDNGNILTISDGTYTTTYTYDSANQLIREDNQKTGITSTWEYDNAGNILKREEYAYTTGTPGSGNTREYVYGDSDWGDLLTGYGREITYDSIGNVIRDNSDNVFTWKNGRQLISYKQDGNEYEDIIHYEYNADGLRTKAYNGYTTYCYVYNGGSLVQMEISNTSTGAVTDTLYFTYDTAGTPQTVEYNDTIYYYVTNLQGDVTAILDGTGAVVVSYTYDAWGNHTSGHSGTGTLASTLGRDNPLRYRGYIYEAETGFYYVSSRYYDPAIGRWINADNNFSNYNLFMYCGNNPVSRIDPNGEHWYYLWIDDLFEAVDELMASVANIKYGRAAYERSYYDPKGANDLWNSRPFQDTKPSQEMQIFTEFMYDHDFVADISVSVDTPIKNTYVKVGASKVLSPNKNINASYVHAGFGASTPSVLPINISCSVGIVHGVKAIVDYAGSFIDIGAGAIYGFDYCWYESSAFSFTTSTAYGIYGGYDYYWSLD